MYVMTMVYRSELGLYIFLFPGQRIDYSADVGLFDRAYMFYIIHPGNSSRIVSCYQYMPDSWDRDNMCIICILTSEPCIIAKFFLPHPPRERVNTPDSWKHEYRTR